MASIVTHIASSVSVRRGHLIDTRTGDARVESLRASGPS